MICDPVSYPALRQVSGGVLENANRRSNAMGPRQGRPRMHTIRPLAPEHRDDNRHRMLKGRAIGVVVVRQVDVFSESPPDEL